MPITSEDFREEARSRRLASGVYEVVFAEATLWDTRSTPFEKDKPFEFDCEDIHTVRIEIPEGVSKPLRLWPEREGKKSFVQGPQLGYMHGLLKRGATSCWMILFDFRDNTQMRVFETQEAAQSAFDGQKTREIAYQSGVASAAQSAVPAAPAVKRAAPVVRSAAHTVDPAAVAALEAGDYGIPF